MATSKATMTSIEDAVKIARVFPAEENQCKGYIATHLLSRTWIQVQLANAVGKMACFEALPCEFAGLLGEYCQLRSELPPPRKSRTTKSTTRGSAIPWYKIRRHATISHLFSRD